MPVQLVEELIEDEYRTIALSPQLRDDIEELVLEDFDALQAAAAGERQQMEQQRVELTGKRRKLLDAHYAGAIPLDLLKTEQGRITGQLMRIQEQLTDADANYEQARATLADTLDLTRDCHAAYLEAGDSTRRLFNQAFFAKIYIDEDDQTRERTVRVDYNEPFDNLLSRLVPAHVHHDLTEEETAHGVDPVGGSGDCTPRVAEVEGSHTNTLVEVTSFVRGCPRLCCRESRGRGLCIMQPPWRCPTHTRRPDDAASIIELEGRDGDAPVGGRVS